MWLILLFAALIIHALGAGSAIGALRYAHAILRLGFATRTGPCGGHAVLILLGHCGIARVRVVGGFPAVTGLRGRHPVRILLRSSDGAGIRVDPDGFLAIAANGLAAQIGNAICRKYTGRKTHTRHHQ